VAGGFAWRDLVVVVSFCVVDRTERLSFNEVSFRNINESLVAFEQAGRFSIICECGREDCRVRIDVTRTEYERARSDGALFLLATGHSDPSVEVIVSTEGDHELVRKTDEAASIAETLDPRSRDAGD
jgi:hypothetical protein